MTEPGPDWRHPYLRVSLLIRLFLTERWDAATWPQIKAELRKAIALRSVIRRWPCWNLIQGGTPL